MEENKNLTPENEEVTEAVAEEENFDIAEAVESQKKGKKFALKLKNNKKNKPQKLKNQALLKRGSYSLAITAAFIAGAIVLNILVGALSNRFVLEFDMSANKTNSISEENIEFIKKVDKEVTVTMCADAESYVGGYMEYYAQQYGVSDSNAGAYYEQTIKLMERYADYNNKIKVDFVDTQSTKFSQIATKYPNEKINYGDILVSCEQDGAERHKIITYEDIYNLTEDSSYAAYGYTMYTVGSNRIETALTSAISYVVSSETKKVAILTGHSSKDYTADYQTLLKTNNYEVEVISDSLITEIPAEYDAIIIAAPTKDFVGEELDAISAYLDNDGNLDKGLIFFANTNSPYLTNLYEFLEQWGIVMGEGILYETESGNHMPDDPTTIGLYPSGKDDMTDGATICITGGNVPMSLAFEQQSVMTVTSVVDSLETTIAAPVGTGAGWKDADNYEKKSYSSVIQSKIEDYNSDNEKISSYVIAFGSTDYIASAYSEQSSVSNKDITLAAAERASGAESTGISFISKTITEESFATDVTESSVNVIRFIFMLFLPVLSIVTAIIIYIKRRNA